MESKSPINVYLITGFLGAGKTTLLNHILKSLEKTRNVVIENEFGKASIDGNLITKQYSQLYELSNGCICCSLDEELYDVLNVLAFNEQRPDNLFIETTGVADAGTVAEIFKREDVGKVFKLRKVICVTDAETVEDYITETEETIRQIVISDLIIINKTSFVSPEYVTKLESLMASLNPFAEIILSSDGKISLDALEGERQEKTENIGEINCNFTHTNVHKIKTVTYKTENVFYRDYLMHTLNVSLMLHYKQIYRIKGFVKFEGSNEKVLVQSTGKRLTFENYGTWDDEDPISELVFIGVGLETAAIQRILRPAIKK
ncbi:GTP-binding protein [Dyadobacter sp. CY345]|uniref:CobW family GTP-binding protein n=1 Tax=Dyadobacter sp. CY345 TaxID=2909335 RepID=UPI001F2B3124|nr:GTP-binding protein [Dyadobacter sp. CY345]MCF2443795.1 GTP-binding protein [Dyadobacter sp. CY345]